jgi:hypothetical protein
MKKRRHGMANWVADNGKAFFAHKVPPKKSSYYFMKKSKKILTKTKFPNSIVDRLFFITAF